VTLDALRDGGGRSSAQFPKGKKQKKKTFFQVPPGVIAALLAKKKEASDPGREGEGRADVSNSWENSPTQQFGQNGRKKNEKTCSGEEGKT